MRIFAREVTTKSISYPGNRQIQETHMAYSAGTQYTRQSLNEKQHAHAYRLM